MIPVAEMGIERGSPERLRDLLATHIRHEARRRSNHVMALKPWAGRDVEHPWEEVDAIRRLEVLANDLSRAVLAPADPEHDALARG